MDSMIPKVPLRLSILHSCVTTFNALHHKTLLTPSIATLDVVYYIKLKQNLEVV